MRLPAWTHSLPALVAADLRRRYAGSVLGAGWAIVTPLLEVAIYGVVFGLVLGVARRSAMPYAVLVASGLLPWAALRESLEGSSSLLPDNRWVRRSRVPIDLLVARLVLTAAPRALIGPLVVLGFALASGSPAAPLTWLVPFAALALQLLATQGLCLLVAPLATLAPDLRPVLTSALTLLTFASPILYPESLAHGRLATALLLNPFTHLLRLYRLPIEPLATPDLLLSLGVGLLSAIAMAAAGRHACSRLWWSARDAL